jgi:SAM-dependent methyltransferase
MSAPLFNPSAANPGYDAAYRDHWLWDFTRPSAKVREWWKLKHHIVRRVGLTKGARVLEIACGQGYHVDRLRRMGFNVTGIDISVPATEFAKRRFPESDYLAIDAAKPLPFVSGSFDLVWSHGAGFFHYSITDDQAERIVRDHLALVKPGGHYLVMISTDRSGSRPGPDQLPYAFEWQHTLEDFRTMLSKHGPNVSVDWFPVRRWVVGPPVATGAGYGIGVLTKP